MKYIMECEIPAYLGSFNLRVPLKLAVLSALFYSSVFSLKASGVPNDQASVDSASENSSGMELSTEGWKTYINPQYKYSIQYPPAAKIVFEGFEDSSSEISLILENPDPNPYTCGLTIESFDHSHYGSVEECGKSWLSVLDESSIIKHNLIKSRGSVSFYQILLRDKNTGDVYESDYFINGHKYYRVSFSRTCKSDKYNDYGKIFPVYGEILRTFRLTD